MGEAAHDFWHAGNGAVGQPQLAQPPCGRQRRQALLLLCSDICNKSRGWRRDARLHTCTVPLPATALQLAGLIQAPARPASTEPSCAASLG